MEIFIICTAVAALTTFAFQNSESTTSPTRSDHGGSSREPNYQVIYYQSNHLYQNHPSSTLATTNTFDSNNVRNAQQSAYDRRTTGSDIALIVRGQRVIISKATVSAFSNDFLSNELARTPRLTAVILDNLANQQKISIHHRDTLVGSVRKKKYATKLPRAAMSASLTAAVGDFSQFKDIIDSFSKYEFSDSITLHNTNATHFYANDEYTVTGCFLSRNIYKKNGTRKIAWCSIEFTDIEYETQCYLFTFKVEQAARFIERYLSR